MEAKTLGDFIFVYEKFAAAENKSTRTIESVTSAVSKFDSFLGRGARPKEIEADYPKKVPGAMFCQSPQQERGLLIYKQLILLP